MPLSSLQIQKLMWPWTRIKTSSSKECIDWLTLKWLKASHGNVLLIGIASSTYIECTSNNCYDIDYDMHNPSSTSLWSKSCILNKLQVDAKFMLKIYILHIMTLKSVENLKKTACNATSPTLKSSIVLNDMQHYATKGSKG